MHLYIWPVGLGLQLKLEENDEVDSRTIQSIAFHKYCWSKKKENDNVKNAKNILKNKEKWEKP